MFGCAILFDEKGQTYVWLLRQFTEAMKRKSLGVVIIDGDFLMKNAILIVF